MDKGPVQVGDFITIEGVVGIDFKVLAVWKNKEITTEVYYIVENKAGVYYRMGEIILCKKYEWNRSWADWLEKQILDNGNFWKQDKNISLNDIECMWVQASVAKQTFPDSLDIVLDKIRNEVNE